MGQLLKPYAQVLFGGHWLGGLLALLATCVNPGHGLAGLLGLGMTLGWARLLGRSKAEIEEGPYGINGLLVGLALGMYYPMSAPLLILMGAAALLTAGLTAVLSLAALRGVGVPVLSVPFVLATWAALLAARRLGALEHAWLDIPLAERADPLGLLALLGEQPEVALMYIKGLGVCFFQLDPRSGLLVALALLIISRWALILSVIGFTFGWLTYAGLGGAPADLTTQLVGFNFILAAIATGGVYALLSPASLVLAGVSGALSAMLSAAMLSLLAPLGLPPLALPFILVTQMLVFTLITATRPGPLLRVTGIPSTPERNLAEARARARRYPDPTVPLIHLPVMGRWQITQGHNGPHTHQGQWAHAWDFEVLDAPTAGAPVVAPAAAQVVRVINHIEDNPIGEVNTTDNWGNLVILWHSGTVYTALCHLQKGSISVVEGQQVIRGQVIGRVGNSGRSPVPHLHLQMQASPQVGSATLPGELLHYVIEPDGEPARYVTHGVPEAGAALSALQVDEAVREALTLAPGMSFEWEIVEGDDRRAELWRSVIDPLGARRLEVDGAGSSGGASATFFADDHYLTFLGYEGPASALLGWLYLGCPRAPYAQREGMVWHDRPSAAPWMTALGRLSQELLMPFADVGGLRTESTLITHPHQITVSTTLEWPQGARRGARRPDRVEVIWGHGRGPCAIIVYSGDAVLLRGDRAR